MDVPVAQLEPILSGFSTTEGRLLASALILVVAVVAGALLAPVLLRQARRVVAREYLGETFATYAGEVNERFPLTTPVRLLLRSLQVALAVATGFALLVVWERTGLIDTASAALLASYGTIFRVAFTVVLLLLAYVGMGLLDDVVDSFGTETNRMTAHQEQIVSRVAQIALLVVTGLVALAVWDANPQGLLVGAGFLGIVVGMAARQTLGALIAGFVLMFSRPFEIGDWVVLDDEEGVVTDITIINTRLENFDGEFVVIPNDKVADSAVTNRSQKGRLRLRIDVGIDYEADTEHAVTVAEDAIATVDTVTESPPPHVFPRSFGDSAVVLEMRFWIDRPTPPKRWRTQAEVVQAVKTAYDDEGIKIPYPQRELSGRAETGGFEVREARATADAEAPSGPRGRTDGGDGR